MNKRSLALLIGLGLMLSGCSLAPEYVPPTAPIPAQWPQGEAYKDAQAIPGTPMARDLKWREFFTDKNLQGIIETALNNNRDLRLAALTVERARALYGIQRAERFPAVNAVGGGGQTAPQRRPDQPRGAEDRRTIQRESGYCRLGNRFFRAHPEFERSGTGSVPGHGAGPSAARRSRWCPRLRGFI